MKPYRSASSLHLPGLVFVALGIIALCTSASIAQSKPPVSLDEFFSYVEIQGVALAPDGSTAVIGTERADWKQNRFRDDLWMWHAKDNSLTPLTTTGHDSDPHYSPDGTYIAFLSNRPLIEDGETAKSTPRLLLVHSGIDEPAEVYLAEDSAHLAEAKPSTHFNKLFTERALPKWAPYRWKSTDGTTIEGVLLYPPGKFGQKHLRMFTLIHGGPGDADGNRFGADWYDWAILAADNNWLVFRPNYRGSSGYGDQFELAIRPEIVSLPGKDILAGVDKLVADGIADPDHLAVGGYSYGGYMTNWLITQTSRFRSAVSGAGAVEHAANWGNDDMPYDDAYILGGLPWQQPARYQSEAALFQFDKVKTPTHDVIGGADIRVAAEEGYLFERALETQNIPHVFLVFPGEGHGLANNPWHGYIKVRDELKWLEKYDHAGK